MRQLGIYSLIAIFVLGTTPMPAFAGTGGTGRVTPPITECDEDLMDKVYSGKYPKLQARAHKHFVLGEKGKLTDAEMCEILEASVTVAGTCPDDCPQEAPETEVEPPQVRELRKTTAAVPERAYVEQSTNWGAVLAVGALAFAGGMFLGKSKAKKSHADWRVLPPRRRGPRLPPSVINPHLPGHLPPGIIPGLGHNPPWQQPPSAVYDPRFPYAPAPYPYQLNPIGSQYDYLLGGGAGSGVNMPPSIVGGSGFWQGNGTSYDSYYGVGGAPVFTNYMLPPAVIDPNRPL